MEKIGIIGAMETEIKLLLENMKNAGGNVKETAAGSLTFYEGKLKGKDVVVVRSGVGKVNAALCAQRLALQFGVDAVINTGIAGAMGSGLKIFDMVVSTDAVYHDVDATTWGYKPTEIPQMQSSCFKADEKLVQAALKAFEKVNAGTGKKIIAGRVASGDQFVGDKKLKEHIKEVCAPACVEMEGAAIAHACYLNKVPFLILRCMSDMADEVAESAYSFNEDEAAEESAKVMLELLGNI